MKHNKNELDVDIIGGEGSLTNAERTAISEFIRLQKDKRKAKLKKTLQKLPHN